MPATMRRFQIQSGFSQVEEKPNENPIPRRLPGVSLMSVGEAKGHEDEEGRKIFVDDETLRQIYSVISNNMGGSVKFKMDHGSGVLATEGWVDNLRLQADKLSGDLNFYESTDAKIVTKIFEMAKKNPTHLGVSLEFAGPDVPTSDNRALARCNEVFTAALVSDPAANKSLFEKKSLATVEKYCMSQPNKEKTMAEEKITTDPNVKPKVEDKPTDEMPAWAQAMCKKFDDSMAGQAALMKRMDEFDPAKKDVPATEKKDQPTTPPAEDEEKKMGRIAEATVKEMAAKLGLRVVAAGAADKPGDDKGEKSFAQLVADKELELQKAGDKDPKNNAMLFCIKAHRKEYAASRLVNPNPKNKSL